MTHDFLHDMGARLAPKKSYLFSTANDFRKYLRTYSWPKVGGCISVLLHFRDLGTHVNTTSRFVGSTLTERIEQAIKCDMRFRWLPHTFLEKIKFILSSALSAGLYGCEAAWANEAALARLTTIIANTISHSAALRSNAILFSLQACKAEVDPAVVILLRRASLFRRMCVKKPSLVTMVHDIIAVYQGANYIGTLGDDGDTSHLLPAPPMGHPHRASWKPTMPPLGPIGLMCYSFFQYACCIDCNFNIHQHGETSFSLLTSPYQYLKPLVRDMAVRARTWFASSKRSVLSGVVDIDWHTLRAAWNKKKDDVKIKDHLQWHLSLSGWSNQRLADVGVGTSECACGASSKTKWHSLCECPLKKHLLTDFMRFFIALKPPEHLMLGLPGQLPSDPDVLFVNTDGEEIKLSLIHISEPTRPY